MFRGAKKRTFRFGKKNVSFPKVETFRFADYNGSGFLISFDICSIGYHRLFILLLVEITFYMTVSQ